MSQQQNQLQKIEEKLQAHDREIKFIKYSLIFLIGYLVRDIALKDYVMQLLKLIP